MSALQGSIADESSNQDIDFPENQQDGPKAGINYYKEACRLYYYNCILYDNYEKLLNERNELKAKLIQFQQTTENECTNQDSEQLVQDLEEKRKRARRNAAEIQRNYICNIQNCNKAYGSEGSLLQHKKLKHNDYAASIVDKE